MSIDNNIEEIVIESGCEGWFTLEISKVGKDGELILQRTIGPFKNLITNQGLNMLGTVSTPMQYCHVGTGTTPPAVTDTQLVNRIASQLYSSNAGISTSGIVSTPTPYAWYRLVSTFAVGAAAGNLSEIGMGSAATGAVLYSRELIRDGSGTPITITVLSDEILTTTYEHRIYPPTTDVTGSINFTGTTPATYSYTVRACEIDQVTGDFNPGWGPTVAAGFGSWQHAGNMSGGGFTGIIGPTTGSPAGTNVGSTSTVASAYSSGSLERAMIMTFGIAITQPIRSIKYYCGFATYQIQFDPAIPKTNANELKVGLKHSWSRRTI